MNNKLKNNKQGILGLDTTKTVIISLLILAVTSIAVFLALTSLQGAGIFTDVSNINPMENSSITLIETGATPSELDGLTSVSMSNVIIINATGLEVIPASNYTVTGAVIASTTGQYNGTAVLVSSDYTSDSQAEQDTNLIVGNITSGTVSFFANVPTFMVLLGVVVLLLIIAIVLVVVGRFGGTGIPIGQSQGGVI